MPIQLFDSLERKLKPLAASQKDGVFRFYNCGPTVYASAHIGNFRTFIINDVLRRLLELEFGKDKVKHVRNLTDVDDRTIGQTQKEKRPLSEITKQWTDKFHADCAALNCLPPHAEPTATGYIREQVDMIQVLMEKGNAYRAADGSVYFKINSFPGYGGLSRIKERELLVTDATADSDHKNSVSDFALWKAHKAEDGDNAWDSPWGRGRPGWHIECSAMSKALLGDTIDLHTGGVDLLFPHHENEIAQSQCCNGTTFSNHWYHSEHLLVDGTTMSKSKGNYYTLSDLVAKGYSPMAVRYALLMGHPRKQLNFTLDSLHAAESALKSLRTFRAKLTEFGVLSPIPEQTIGSLNLGPVFDALCDDLNAPSALGALFSAINSYDASAREPVMIAKDLLHFDQALFALGLIVAEPVTRTIIGSGGLTLGGSAKIVRVRAGATDEIQALAEKRWTAKLAKDYATADSLRKELNALGWSMLDDKQGYTLEPLKK